MNATSHEPWLVRFVNARWPVLAVAALLLPAWSLRTVVDRLESGRKAQLTPLEKLTVTVVAGRPAEPVEGAQIAPLYPDERLRPLVDVHSLGNGRYELERKRQETTLFVSNADRTQAAIAEIRRDQAAVTVALVPLVTATGRLVRDDTGEPLGDVEFEWDLSAHHWQSWIRGSHPPGCGGKSRTRADASFTLPEVFADAEYRLLPILQVPHFGRTMTWHTHGVMFRVEEGGPTELGDFRVPGQLASFEERFAAEFESDVPLAERLSRAQQDAGQKNQRVLAILANPRDEAAFELGQSLRRIDSVAHYRLLWISVAGPPADETRRWASERNLPITPLNHGLLVALDEEGQAVGHLAAKGFASGSESGAKVTAFIDQHIPLQADTRPGH